jgi:hypothetical protein
VIKRELLVPSLTAAEWGDDVEGSRCYGTEIGGTVKDHDWVLFRMSMLMEQQSTWYCRRCRSIERLTFIRDE